MNTAARDEAVRLLAEARRTGVPLERLPPACRPESAEEAYEIQLALLDRLGEALTGWKVSLSPRDGLMMGIVVGSRLFGSGAKIPTRLFAMRGVEAEIAYRVVHALPPRAAAYDRGEIEAALEALPVIELLDTRFASYDDTPPLERAADFLCNGALIAGSGRGSAAADWSGVVGSVAIDGREVLSKTGGHPAGDPLLPAIALINHLRLSTGVAAGLIITTGSLTGTLPAPPRSHIEIAFEGLGRAACELV